MISNAAVLAASLALSGILYGENFESVFLVGIALLVPFIALAAFLLFAPTSFAADGSASGSLESLFAQLVAFFLGEEPELGLAYPPSGQSLTGEEPELGLACPPNG